MSHPAQEPAKPRTALVVDDDPWFLSVIRDELELLGINVFEAQDGQQALGLVQAEAATIELAIIDFLMPGLNGLETFTAMRAINPNLKAILCSGNSKWQCLGGQSFEGLHFMQKPELLATLEDTLDQLLFGGVEQDRRIRRQTRIGPESEP